MIVKTIVPVGWPCTLEECPPGPFIWFTYLERPMIACDHLCFKSEYRMDWDTARVMAFNEAGEFFALGNDTQVQPVEMVVHGVQVVAP